MTDEPVTLYVLGQPVPQPRAKFSTKSWSARTPDPSGRLASWKGRVEGAFLGLSRPEKRRMRSWRRDRLALEIGMQIRLPKARTSKLEQPTKVPDWDNLAKGIQDALTDAGAWKDDCYIVRAQVLKCWATEQSPPGATIRVAPYREGS